MPAGHGLRARTRDSFSRGFREKGYIPLSTYLTTYKLGDYVDIKVNSAVQKVTEGIRSIPASVQLRRDAIRACQKPPIRAESLSMAVNCQGCCSACT